MTTKTTVENSVLTPKAQSAYRASLLLAVAASLAVPLYTFLAIQANAWQVYLSLVSLVGFAGAAWFSTRLCRRGQTMAGIWVLIVTNILAALVVSVVISDIGVPLGIATFVAILQLATQHLPAQVSFRAILFVTIAAIAMGMVDYLPVDFQYVVPFLQTATFTITALILVLYSVAVIRQFSTLPLRNKLLLSFLLVTFLSVTLVGFFTAQRARQALIDNANQSLLAAAAQTAISLDTFINNNKDAVRIEAGFPDFVNFLELPAAERSGTAQEARVRQILLQLSRKNPTYILSYALIDSEGRHIVDTFFPEQGLDASQLSYFQEPFQSGAPYVSPVEQSLTEGGVSLYFSAPVRNTAGDIIGVLRVSYNVGILQQVINQFTGLLGEDSAATLLDEYGIRLADGENPELIMKSLAPLDANLITDLQEQRRLPDRAVNSLTSNQLDFAAGYNEWEETPVFAAKVNPNEPEDHLDNVAVVALQTQPWRVAYSQSQAAFLTPIQTQTQATTIVALVIALLVALSAIAVAQLLTAPITRLTTVAEKVAAGDLQARAVIESEDEIGTLATALNNMTTQLSELVGTLEQRVEARTRALATSTEVSRRLSTILDPQQLVTEVVEQVKLAFNYYHAHIYLLDEQNGYLLMAGGTGEVGAMLLQQGHKIPVGRGLVGRAAATNTIILVPDVTQEPGWLANPLLPDTKAEIAVPISVKDQVFGVLDVQNAAINSLGPGDADLLQSIANQVAIAIQNARLYAQAQQQAERAALLNDISQKIQSATTIERVVQIAAQELGQALKAQSATVQISAHSEPKNGYTA